MVEDGERLPDGSGPPEGASTPGEAEAQPTPPRPKPHLRSGYRLLRPLPLRWADIDRYGHANNVAYLSWFDTAVNDWYAEEGFPPGGDPRFVVAETGCAFFREIVFSDRIEIGIRSVRIGRSAVTYDMAVFAAGEPEARAQGRYVHVLVAGRKGSAVPIEGRRREMLEATR